jgi:hypothetical protein
VDEPAVLQNIASIDAGTNEVAPVE